MNPNLSNLVLDCMNHVVKLQKHIYLDDPVVEVTQLFQFTFYMLDQLTVCSEVNCLNVYVHNHQILVKQ